MEKETSKNGTYTKNSDGRTYTETIDGITYVCNYHTVNVRTKRAVYGHPEEWKISEGYFKNEVKDGKWSLYYLNGSKESEGFFKNGEKVGEWAYWFPNGEIKSLEVKQWEDDDEAIEVFPGSDDDYDKYLDDRDSDQPLGREFSWYEDDDDSIYTYHK